MTSSLPRRRFLTALPALGLVPHAATAQQATALQHIVFGSCLDTHEHPMLDRTLTLPRDLFIFMGDNVYADRGIVGKYVIPNMREKYALLKQSRFFQGLRGKGAIVATWDDHDYGQNDGGAGYAQKQDAQREFWDWLDEPADSPRRKREGIYDAHVFGPVGRRVQVILLDTRYFRSPLQRVDKDLAMLGGSYTATRDTSTTMLGEAQWRWLEDALKQPAELRLIVSSIQFAAELHGGECWANFPHEQQRMMNVLKNTKASGVVFLSGDRHWCEVSRLDGPAGYPLFDITASSMTQKHPRGTPTPNKHRALPSTYHLPSVGHMKIDWNDGGATITTRIIDVDGKAQIEHALQLSQLQAK